MMAVRSGRLRGALALVVLWGGWGGLSSGESIVVGTGDITQTTPKSAAIYCWGGSDWVKISPEPGVGLGAHMAVYSLCEYRGRLYAGTDGGQVYAYANGTTWIRSGLNGSEIPSQVAVLSLATYQGNLYAGTKPAGLYRYDPNASRWSKVDIDLNEMVGVVTMTTWTDPNTQVLKLYLGDVYHDMVMAYDGSTYDKELSNLAPLGSCIWDFQEFEGHLYACSYHGRIYVRSDTSWSLATPWVRDYSNAWEMEVFQGNLYVACDGTLERLVKEGSSWSSLQLERVFSMPWSNQGIDPIKAMVASEDLYLGTELGRVYCFDGRTEPVQMGSTLPSVFTIHTGTPLASSLKVERLDILLEGSMVQGEPLTYRIDYGLSGESLETVTMTEELPSGVDLVVAKPEPHRIDGRVLTWDLGKIGSETSLGSLSVVVRPKSGLALGSELVNTCLVLEGTALVGGAQKRTLYGTERLYVDPNSKRSAPDGCSWETAFRTLGEALQRADAYYISEVWVAEGLYELPEPIQDKNPIRVFTVPPGLALRGGFTGHEKSIQERHLGAHPTILMSWGAMEQIIVVDTRHRRNPDPQRSRQIVIEAITLRGPGPGFQIDGIRAMTAGLSDLRVRHCTFEECFHGLFLEAGSSVTLEDCLFKTTIFGVSASGAGTGVDIARCLFQGNLCGAYLGEGSSATLQGCTFTQNGTVSMWDDVYSGGIVAFGDEVHITNCHFSGNQARLGGGLYASLPEGRTGPEVKISGCAFVGNTVIQVPVSSDERPTGTGGGLFLDRRGFLVTDSWFVDNSAQGEAGAFECRQSNGRVIRSFFYGNQATGTGSSCGGAMGIRYNQGLVGIYRSVFADNRASYGGAMVCTANGEHPTDLVNCTFIKNQGLYWAGGALSVCSEKVDPLATIGGRAAVTNCLFYGNTGKEPGSVMEVYAGSTVTLTSSAMDGAYYQLPVIWVQSDPQKRPLGQIEITDENTMQNLSLSPFRPDVALDYRLRRPSPVEKIHPSDGGLALTIEDVNRDVEGDPVPLGNGWDIGADELNPDGNATCLVWPPQVVCDCTAKGASYFPIYFRSARYAKDAASEPDGIILVRMDGGVPQTVASIPITPGRKDVSLGTTTPEGLADGYVTFFINELGLHSGVYVAYMVQGGATPIARDVSCPFFVRSVPPDPRASTWIPETP